MTEKQFNKFVEVMKNAAERHLKKYEDEIDSSEFIDALDDLLCDWGNAVVNELDDED